MAKPSNGTAVGEEGPRNPQLREYLTRVNFSLTLSRQHVLALTAIAEEAGRSVTRRIMPSAAPWYSQGLEGLIRRGLVRQRQGFGARGATFRQGTWELTEAGNAVAVLLKEAGLWDDLAYTAVRGS